MNDAILVWDALKSKISSLVKTLTGNCLRCERYDVTTAPNGSVIGVTQPFGNTELFIPYSQEVANAVAGDTVLVAWHNTMSNAKAISYGDGFRGSPSSLSNPNLLDNPWFTINQREQTSYTGAGAYSIDRWRRSSSRSTVTIHDDYITVGTTESATTVGYIQQFLEFERFENGKTYTISLLYNDGHIESKSGVINGTSTSSFRTATYDNTYIQMAYSQTTFADGFIFNIITTYPSKTSDIRAAKLELGSVSTLENDVAPNYASELLKCERYYYRMSAAGTIALPIGSGYFSSSTAGRFCFQLPIKMRTAPSIVTSANLRAVSSGSTYTVTLGTSYMRGNAYIIQLTGSGFPENEVFVIYFYGTDTALEFSADL